VTIVRIHSGTCQMQAGSYHKANAPHILSLFSYVRIQFDYRYLSIQHGFKIPVHAPKVLSTCAIDHAGARALRCTMLLAYRCVCTLCVGCLDAGGLVQLSGHLPTAPCTVRCRNACLRAAALALRCVQRLAAPSPHCCSIVCSPMALHLAHRLTLTAIVTSHPSSVLQSICDTAHRAVHGNFIGTR
jgi:hypothetical protein